MTRVFAGQRLGRWTLTRRLGSGGHAEVWEARDDATEQRAAIKILAAVSPDTAERGAATAPARFDAEIRAMDRAAGVPGVLPVLDRHDEHDPRRWFAMPIATPLRAHLAARNAALVLEAVAQLAETLASLHERGLAHRDIRCTNLLWRDGRLQLADFGSARRIAGPGVASPNGAMPRAERVGPASDVFALAKTLWSLLTGEPPFEGRFDHNAAAALAVRGIESEALNRLLRRATRRRPIGRPTMRAFASALADCRVERDSASQSVASTALPTEPQVTM